MQVKFSLPCDMSATGSHDATVTLSPEDGRVVGFNCPCDPDSDDCEVARTLGSHTCADILHSYRTTVRERTGYAPAARWSEELEHRIKVHGAKVPSYFLDMLASAVTGSVRVRESRKQSDPIVAAGLTDMDRRWQKVVRSVAKEDGLQYEWKVRHVPGHGVKVQTRYVDSDGDIGGWHTVAVAPTGSKHAFALRNNDSVGTYTHNRRSGKPDWCSVCGAPIRGLHRHVSSAPHKAKVRRDIFRLVKAVWPHRVVREAWPQDIPTDVQNGLIHNTHGGL